MRVRVRVPATTSNIGPGFDAFGMALDLCNEFTVDTDAEPGVAWEGEGAGDLPVDGSDLVSRTMRDVAATFEGELPALRLAATNRVPLARGLGSSSAAIVGAIAMASRLLDLGLEGDPAGVFAIAARIEGHPDNAAPACFGGVTVALPGGVVRRFDPHPALAPIALVPDVALSTAAARDALPSTVPFEDAVFNLAHAAVLLEGLTTDPEALRYALEDRLHQSVRLALVPEVADVFDELRRRHVPVCVSGAGSTLLAFALPGVPAITETLLGVSSGWRILPLGPRRAGFEVDG